MGNEAEYKISKRLIKNGNGVQILIMACRDVWNTCHEGLRSPPKAVVTLHK